MANAFVLPDLAPTPPARSAAPRTRRRLARRRTAATSNAPLRPLRLRALCVRSAVIGASITRFRANLGQAELMVLLWLGIEPKTEAHAKRLSRGLAALLDQDRSLA